MTDFDTDFAVLIDACSGELGEPERWPVTDGYPDSLALCIIDAIYSVGARYSMVLVIIDRYRQMRAQAGGNAETDDALDLAGSVSEAGGPDRWAAHLGQRRANVAATYTAPRKAASIAAVARILPSRGVVTAADLRAAVAAPDTHAAAQRVWRIAAGPGCANTWHHALRLAHTPIVRADRAVVRYVANAIGIRTNLLSPQYAGELVAHVAQATGWDTAALAHAIWRYQSGRQARAAVVPARYVGATSPHSSEGE